MRINCHLGSLSLLPLSLRTDALDKRKQATDQHTVAVKNEIRRIRHEA